tara:strand:+ start:282 stop:1022 length:741 start_codon:yes stop_codon:yes gene_type:complete
MSYSVILPTLNEAGHIVQLVNQISEALLKTNEKFEIIIVDDSSTDKTPELCRELEKKRENTYFYSRTGQKKNLAKSINLGIEKSKFENIIWLDADFQHPPEYIYLFHKYASKYDLIIFSRFLNESKRYFEDERYKKEINENQSVLFNKICRLFLYKDLSDYTSGFICIKKKIFNNYKLKGYYGEYFVNLINHCKIQKFSIIELSFNEKARYSGISKTYPEFSLKYVILLYKYMVCLIKNVLIKWTK